MPTKQNMLESVRQNLLGFRKTLADRGRLERIIEAMDKVDRAKFIDSTVAYSDTAQPVGEGQTISQPSTVGRMLLLLNLKSGQGVLEAGSASGWNAALLSYLVYPGQVISLELVPELAEKSVDNIKKAKRELPGEVSKKFNNIEMRAGNVFDFNDGAMMDKIILTAGIDETQLDKVRLLAQDHLVDGGRLLCPRRFGPILIIDKKNSKLKEKNTDESYAFVPLIS